MNSLLTIKEMPAMERPREKALQYGVESLSDSELLAILIGNGSKGQNAISLAARILSTVGDIRQLSLRTIHELKAIPGIGTVKAIEIKACLEIARRFQQVILRPGEILNGSQQVFSYYHEKLRDQKKEKFFSLMLDCKHRLIREELISIGSLNLSIVHPREVFAPAIRESAESILLLHNHPSGDPLPSKEDIYVTKRLIEVGHLVGIEILDHIIIGNGCYVSFLEQKLF
jgi:DNA repair protein RadC